MLLVPMIQERKEELSNEHFLKMINLYSSKAQKILNHKKLKNETFKEVLEKKRNEIIEKEKLKKSKSKMERQEEFQAFKKYAERSQEIEKKISHNLGVKNYKITKNNRKA